MGGLWWILWGILIACGAVLCFMIVRAALIRPPKKQADAAIKLPSLDSGLIASHLSEAVQIPTVSLTKTETDGRHFLAYHAWLEKTYPALHQAAEKTLINDYSLIYFLKGTDPALKPACFLAHQDVVPAPKDGWEVDPFSGEIKDGFVWGRGAMDMKNHMVAVLEAVEYILKSQKPLKRGIYLCFGHDEEVSSEAGAPFIVKHLKEKGVQLDYVIDEGGIMADGNNFGIPHLIALIGTCEKGYADIQLTVKKDGGHASSPKTPTCVGMLAKAVAKVEANPMRPYFNPPTKELFKDLSPHMPFHLKVILANRDVLSPLLKFVFSKIPMANSLVRTTFAPTMLEGASRRNVLPPVATANINVRILTGDTSEKVLKHIKKTIGKKVEAEITNVTEPCPITPTDTEQYRSIVKSMQEVWPDAIAAPFMFIAADDARFFYELTPNVVRFSPFVFGLSDQKRVHGLNERCPVDALTAAVQFFIRQIENTCL